LLSNQCASDGWLLLYYLFHELGREAAILQDKGPALALPLQGLPVTGPGQVDDGVLHIGGGRLELGCGGLNLSGAWSAPTR
jgi:hypothetical protein